MIPSRVQMEIEYKNIEKLIPYINNPRDNVAAIDKVAASIKEFGFQQPIVIDRENVIVAGHTRYLAAQKLELKKVPVQVASGLSELQIKAYRIADNRVAQEASWDDELLNLELTNLDLNEFNLDLTGFDPDEIEILLNGPAFEPATIDEQNNLDQLEPIYCTCPKCGHEFDSRENKT